MEETTEAVIEIEKAALTAESLVTLQETAEQEEDQEADPMSKNLSSFEIFQ